MDREAIQERFGIVGTSAVIRNVIDRARMVAKTDITVLIEGESGVGKELVAEMLHELGGRRHGPRIIVNCGAIPEGLLESELFGAEKGAYTGAVERRSGYFEDADGGTIFLDEIGEMPQAAQVRLLRVLETGTFSRVGSSQARHTDVRVIAATNKDLAREVEAGRFREDLYYRLSTVIIKIPPLRERPEDILPIFQNYLHRFTQQYNSAPKRLDASAEQLLKRYHWPGNVRELRNLAEQAVVLLRKDTLTAEDLRPHLRGVSAQRSSSLLPVRHESEPDVTDDFRERELIYRALIELRMEMRDLKEHVGQLSRSGNIAVPRRLVEEEGFPAERGDYVILGDGERDYASFVEDATYEVEHDEPGHNGSDREPVIHQERPGVEPAQQNEQKPDELPTLEDAERDLIIRALQRFEGNRRQTAKALGISERTLYRKLKDIDIDL